MTISSFWDPAGNIMHGNMHCDASGITPEIINRGPPSMWLQQMSPMTAKEHTSQPLCAIAIVAAQRNTSQDSKAELCVLLAVC